MDKLSPIIQTQQSNVYNLNKLINNSLTNIANELYHASEVLKNTSKILDEIEHDFELSTNLSKKDVIFLVIAIALQCVRQYAIPNNSFRLSATEGDELVNKIIPKNWQDILCSSVPYDAIRVDPSFKNLLPNGTGLGGTTHRVLTLGHDPMFGWLFGTANIMSDSLTKTDFITTYKVNNMVIHGNYNSGTFGMINDCLSFMQMEKKLLPISILRQMVHYGSDFFTKRGLPIPILGSINNNLALTLSNKFNIDTYEVLRSSMLTIFINLIISYLHTLFYDSSKDGNESLYEVKTMKVVEYSNLIATSSNIIYTTVNAYLGNTAALKSFDIGGLLVTIYKLLSDRNKVAEIKKEFLEKEFYNRLNL